jgi:plasmid stabilization system protein ParE
MAGYRLSAAAQADLIDILAWTHQRFGESARERYKALVVAALRDISTQPDRCTWGPRNHGDEAGGLQRNAAAKMAADDVRAEPPVFRWISESANQRALIL